MLKRIYFSIFFLILTSSAGAQIIEDYITKIDLKLKKDKNYLNLHYLEFEPGQFDPSLTTIPREGKKAFQMKFNDDIRYRLVFLKEGLEVDSVYLLYLEEIKLNSVNNERLFGALDDIPDDTSRVLSFRDIYNLKTSFKSYYNAFYNLLEEFIAENDEAPLPSLLGINPDKQLKSGFGVSARDNKDFLNFAYINGMHWYPREEEGRSSRRRKSESLNPYRIDVSLSTLTFSHEFMDLSVGSSAFELSTDEKVLNLLPWESSTVQAGFRTLIALSENNLDYNEAMFIDVKFLARFKMNSNAFFNKLPYIMSDAPRLNVGSGLVGEISLSRPFSLPFINLYFSTGQQQFENPAAVIVTPDAQSAFFSFTQVEGTMSFYWSASDKLINRFRVDLGFAFYDIWRADYDSDNSLLNTELLQKKIYPLVALHYNFVPQSDPLFGSSLKVLDNQVKLKGWVKIIEFAPMNVLRFEAFYVSPPFARGSRQWDTDGGSMFQFRYRYGL